MISKFSVKKPYTVVVGIILVMILGVVAFTKMTTDLLPSINLPYAIVMTTYPGASPETVEEVVTKPVEQAMATVSNIEAVQSVSSENVSMVILQFAQTTNMDSVSIEMRENIDQISGYWDESVGKPIIMKLNPDMLPVMTAAVEKEGLEGVDITDYVNREMLSDIESLEGVASVSLSGGLEEGVQVIIRQDKIDAMNVKVQNALNGKFEDAQEELDEAMDEIQSGKSQLQSGQNELTSQFAQAAAAEAEILKGEAEIKKAEQEMDAQAAELANTKKQLEAQKAQLETGELVKDEMYQAAYAQAYEEALNQAVAQAEAAALEEINKQVSALLMQKEEVEQAIAAGLTAGEDVSGLQMQLVGLEAALEMAGSEETKHAAKEQAAAAAKAALDEMFPTQFDSGYTASALDTVNTYLQQVAEGEAQIEAGKQQLETTKEQLQQGKISLAQAQAQLESAKITATIQMAAAQSQLSSAEAQLKQGQEQLEESKEQALDAADLNNTITSDMISQILMAQNFSMPAGYVTEEGIDYMVRVGDSFENTEEMEDLILFDMNIEGLEPIRLKDVADVAVYDNSSEIYASINGHQGILLSIQKQTGYSTGEVSKRINDYFEKTMEKEEGLHVTALMDQGIYIDMIVNSVLQNLIMGGILAIVILFLFLKDIRPTAVIACSIPISVLTCIVLMYFSGVTLNIISLSGLALGVGMLVDNSVVVIENIYRMRNEGYSARKAAVAGARQVAGAITASTLTTVCVFLPIVFTEGMTRQLFVDMGLTIGYSLLASLIVALTLVPMMSAGLLRNTKEKAHPFFDKIVAVYEHLIRIALNHKVLVLAGSLAVLVLSGLLAMSRGTGFMPEMDSTQMTVTVALDETATVTEVGKAADEVSEILLEYEDVTDVGAMVGSGGISLGGSSGEGTSATVYVLLKENKKHTNEELAKMMEEDFADLSYNISISASNMDMSALGGSGVSVMIKGKELDTLQESASLIAEAVAEVEGTIDVSDGMEESTTELRLVVKKGEAMKHNLTVAQVYQQVAAKIATEKDSTTLATASKDYPVTIVNGTQTSLTREDIKNMTLTATTQEGEKEEIAITELVDFEDAFSPQSIQRSDQSRYITVSAGIDAEHNIGLVAAEIKDVLEDIELPEGYTAEMTGEDEMINEAMIELLKMLALAVVFMYLIMVAQFQSLLSPFIVMFTIPLAFTGGFIGLWAAGMEVSVIAMIGFIMLSGIIVNNGIVLVDYVNQLRAEGMEKKDALVEAGKTRMRPILMTALTTILGLSTMAIGMGMGSDMVQPMAVVTIGGLIYGTVLTLFVVPCIYDILNRKNYCKEDELDDETVLIQ